MKKLKRLLYLKFARSLSLNRNSSDVPVPTIISEGTRICGDIISDGILHVDGQVEGDVTCDELVIGIKGRIDGAVSARTLQLYGALTGKVSAEKVFLAKTSKLIGDAEHNSIAIEPGAYIEGRCIRVWDTIPAEQSKPDLLIADASKKQEKTKEKKD